MTLLRRRNGTKNWILSENKTEDQLKQREEQFEIDQRNLRQNKAHRDKSSDEEDSYSRERGRAGAKKNKPSQGVDIMDIALQNKSDEDSEYEQGTTRRGGNTKKRGRNGKKVGAPKAGKAGCK